MPERLGAYEIVSRLGAGGMGEVYRARDTRLDREVAIKVLPDFLAGDPERIARFRREARVAASLHHPHIAGIYGFEDEDGAHFLVMELVEGITLAERLRQGQMPIDEALAIVEQIAEGLEAAHESGIVHRDLKPSNIKMTPAGRAKILDFGLAKAAGEPPPAPGVEPSGSVTAAFTSPGMVFGTVPYMSPEQARGRPVDKRSDIWSLGCVLYECLSGRRAFDGDTATDVVAKILERDPDWEALPPRTPPRVRELLARCLEKDPRRRVRDSGDVRMELERALAAREWTSSGAVRVLRRSAPPWRRVVPWAVAATAVAAALLWVMTAGRGVSGNGEPGGAARAVPIHVVMTDPDVPHETYQDFPSVAISPDGLTIAYTGRGPKGAGRRLGLYLRRADGIHARRLDLPCDQNDRQEVYEPFFSPDGKSLGFTCGELYRISLSGGPAIKLYESAIPLKGATWSSAGIIFSPAAKSGLVLVREGGGPLETLTVPDASKGEVSHRWPSILPDGRHVLFTIKKEGITTFDQGEVALLDLETRTYKTLIRGATFARYLSTGYLVFARGSTILALAFDPDRGSVEGQPIPVVEGVMTEPGSGAAQFAVARDTGTLVYVPGGPNVVRNELAWIDRRGTVTPIGAPPQPYHATYVSPDGSRIAATVFGATDGVVVYDLAHRSLSRVTSEGNCGLLAWSPDGRRILYGSDQDGLALMLRDADGSGAPTRLDVDVTTIQMMQLAHVQSGPGFVYTSNGSLWLVPLSGDLKPRRLGVDPLPLGATASSLSPDGRWLTYTSDALGRSEVFIKPFPEGSRTWQISRSGGTNPYWSSRGSEVFYQRGSRDDRWICSARLAVSPTQITAAAPTDLLKVPADVDVWSPHPDGERFVLVRQLPATFKGDRVEAVLNWSEEVKTRVSGH
jgi:eukaryotic-like serine/threonine-protein kinase